jgi:FkbM family methyltransferase
MTETLGLRDKVRLRYPRLLAFYQRHVVPRIMRERRHIELSEWAREGERIVARAGMHGIRFERDGIWIDDGNGFLWAYAPDVLMSALGTEFGMRYEQFEIELLAERLPRGGTLVDIGANAGLHCVQLARLVDGLRVYAFEPVGSTYALLERNIAKNGTSEQVHPLHMALSDRPGTLRLTTRLSVANFVVPDGVEAAPGVTEEVPARPLDDVLAERDITRVDAIKCDVEGAELGVLRGARAMLERDHPLLLLEIDERWAARYGNTGRDVLNLLAELGYRYERLVDDRLLPPTGDPRQDLEEGRNFLFTAS